MDTRSPAEHAELAAYRALRGELAPWIDSIAAEFVPEQVVLHVYHHAAPSGWQSEFEQVVECQWDQVFPSSERPMPGLVFRFHPAEAFATFDVTLCLLYTSPWSGPAT